MMLYPAINELKDKTDSRYTLCILTAKRARDIISGKPVLTDVEAERPVSLAANEIYEDKITFKRDTDHAATAELADAIAEVLGNTAEDEEADAE